MSESTENMEELMRGTLVGDTIRLTLDRSSLSAEVRDRIAPVMSPPADASGPAVFQGFTKSADGEWDLDSVMGAKGSPTVEIVVRRIASSI